MSKRRKKKNNRSRVNVSKGVVQNTMIVTKDSSQSKMSKVLTNVKPIQPLKIHYHKKTPLYMNIAMDLYINQLSYKDVAKKYQRSREQIYWIVSKSIRSNLRTLWSAWHKAKKDKKEFKVPFYMTVAMEVIINHKSLEIIAQQYKKPLQTIKRVISTSLKKNLPYVWQLMVNNNIVSVKRG